MQGKLHSVKLGQFDETGINLDDISFDIEIVEDVLILDEEASNAPVAETNANVRVKRTIKADEWSTICMPFAMTSEQVTAAFGEGVQIMEFKGWKVTAFDNDDNTTAIEVSFSIALIDNGQMHMDNAIYESTPPPLISRTLSSGAFLPEIHTYIEQNVNTDSCIHNKVVRKSDKMKGVFGLGTFRSGLIYDLQGRRISVSSASSVNSVLPKGVYIVNGKKRVVSSSRQIEKTPSES